MGYDASKKKQISKKTRFYVFLRSSLEQGSWNFERMHNLGFTYSVIPVIKQLYPDHDHITRALKRHMTFFNTTPIMQSFIAGVIINLEERYASKQITEPQINQIKTAMMGPLASIGDPLWWGITRPVIAACGAALCYSAVPVAGPLFFFIAWNILRVSFRAITQVVGYHEGVKVISIFNTGFLKNLTKGMPVFGMFMMGCIIATFVKITGVVGFTDQITGSGYLGSVLASSISALVALLLLFICLRLLKKRIRPIWIITGILIVSIVIEFGIKIFVM
ncbi:PTS system mannose/fructose/sorbose family transporter subunit IID [Lentilactobacillus sp. Marseille-Q4993]|uniref:PTS system mannose/fructose/sorbose family transporter subunit IID n=1 Tax=Lentilactobacillus sp. Marseille-Q4993 TaxID=3039492 RepID=UPI0024BC7012|nr:PTS system mannose/fructose/sorbose family transporter subunit IID [Lentilactobacillus sp. Marseille-Q4993]